MYIDENINFEVIFNEHRSKTWILCIQIKEGLMKGTYGVLYKSPSEKINDFLCFLDEFLEDVVNENMNNMIIGDLNINVAKKSKNSKKYLEKIKEHNLVQVVSDFTRVDDKRNCQTIIDHVLTNNEENINHEVVKDEKISDHFMIKIKLNTTQKVLKLKPSKAMKSEVEKINWDQIDYTSPNCASSFLEDNIKICINNLTEQTLIRENHNAWYNAKLKKLKIEKDMSYKKYEYTGKDEDKCLWTALSVKYKEEINVAKSEHVHTFS